MGKFEKLREQILSGDSDSNTDLKICAIFKKFEFEESKGRYFSQKRSKKPNLQRDGSKAKNYQVSKSGTF